MKHIVLSLLLVLALCLTATTTLAADYASGTYSATATGMGQMTVTVTIEDGAITAVDVDGPNETPGISDPALAQIPQAIIDAQSTEVDIVSGATLTSNGIIAGVGDCLAQASGGGGGGSLADGTYTGSGTGMGALSVTVTIEGGAITAVDVDGPNETPGISDPALAEVPQAIIDAQSVDVDIVSGATLTSNGIMQAVGEALAQASGGSSGGALSDGSFTASATGMGELSVTVTIEGGQIVSVDVDAPNETEGIADPALAEIPQAIIDAQSAEVDIVSGATLTSNGIMQAVSDALDQSRQGGGSSGESAPVSTTASAQSSPVGVFTVSDMVVTVLAVGAIIFLGICVFLKRK